MKQFKRITAVALALVMALTGLTVTGEAAAKKPTAKKQFSLTVGNCAVLKITANGWKIRSVKAGSSAPKKVKVVKTSQKAVTVKGLKEGTGTITTTVKAKKNNKTKTFKLKTKVTVEALPDPAGSDTSKIKYLKWSNDEFSETVLTEPYTLIGPNSEPYRELGSGAEEGDLTWVVIDGDVLIQHRIRIKGTCNMILKDGCKLTAERGISVFAERLGEERDTLNIYAQSMGSKKGALSARADRCRAGIGGDDMGGSWSCGTVSIYGGDISAAGGEDGAGIGGGFSGRGGDVSIYGGTISAVGGSGAAGIGTGNYNSANGSLKTVLGVTVYAQTDSQIDPANLPKPYTMFPMDNIYAQNPITPLRYMYITYEPW